MKKGKELLDYLRRQEEDFGEFCINNYYYNPRSFGTYRKCTLELEVSPDGLFNLLLLLKDEGYEKNTAFFEAIDFKEVPEEGDYWCPYVGKVKLCIGLGEKSNSYPVSVYCSDLEIKDIDKYHSLFMEMLDFSSTTLNNVKDYLEIEQMALKDRKREERYW